MIADAYARRKKQSVTTETWGHLAPEPGRHCPGTMLFAHCAYGGERVLIDATWDSLRDSPWLFEEMQAFIEAAQTREGGVYRWHGTYTWLQNGSPRFSGETVEVTT